jgi:hypothetical protein
MTYSPGSIMLGLDPEPEVHPGLSHCVGENRSAIPLGHIYQVDGWLMVGRGR